MTLPSATQPVQETPTERLARLQARRDRANANRAQGVPMPFTWTPGAAGAVRAVLEALTP